MIQAVMLITLGFLVASLIGVLVAPSLWSRAYRLSRKRLERTLPLSISEIEATQDQLRASYAVRLRRLETALANAKQKAALQLVDNSRLQMQIAASKETLADLDLKLSERTNAATVLEQTITRRFPEMEREITGLRSQLLERSQELQDLTNRLSRKDENIEIAQRAVAVHEAELLKLRQAFEKTGGDKGGRLLRRPSQWNLDDYRAEYDRLHLEQSKLRQQLTQLQDRDAQQVGLIKGELQRIAELVLASAKARPEPAPRPSDLPPAAPKRATTPDRRRDRPVAWMQGAGPASSSSERVPPNNAGTAAATNESASRTEDKDQPERPAFADAKSQAQETTQKPQLQSAQPFLNAARTEMQAAAAPESVPSSSNGKPKILRDVTHDEPDEKGTANQKAVAQSNVSDDASLQSLENKLAVAHVAVEALATLYDRKSERPGPAAGSQRRPEERPTPQASSSTASPSQESERKVDKEEILPNRNGQSGTQGFDSPTASRTLSPVSQEPAPSQEPTRISHKAFTDAKELETLSELLALSPGANGNGASNRDGSISAIAKEARNGEILDLEAGPAISTPDSPRVNGHAPGRNLLDRLKGLGDQSTDAEK